MADTIEIQRLDELLSLPDPVLLDMLLAMIAVLMNTLN